VDNIAIFSSSNEKKRSDRQYYRSLLATDFWILAEKTEREGIMSKQARNVVFTQFLPDNYLPGEEPPLLDPSTWKDCSYCIYQLEMCPQTGRLHYQGYLECVGKKTWVFMHENWEGLETARFAARSGSQMEAINYCKKGESALDGPWEWGERKEQGRRSDLLDIKRKIDDMEPLLQIQEDHFASFVRHSKFFKEYKRQKTPKRNFKTKVFLFVGGSGRGKSQTAELIAHYLGRVYKATRPKSSGLYWDDYDGQEVTWIDEFDGNYMKPTDFNELCDKYEFVVPVHGGAGHQFVSEYIIICSNYLPKFWWKKRSANQQRQTYRRIDWIFPFLDLIPPNPNPLGFSRKLNLISN